MNENYRLGIDLGTNSLGWALWELDDDGKPVRLRDAGVRIFTNGRESGKKGEIGESLAVARRNARGMRRRRDRLLQRKRNLINTLVHKGLWPQNPKERQKFSMMDPYTLRKKAVYEKLTNEELGRVLLHLCQRRGFKSNRKDTSKDDKKGRNKERIRSFNKELERQNAVTLGEYLNAHKCRGVRFTDESEYYPERAHYEDEFDIIQERQAAYFPSLDWDTLRHIIFYQRRLQPQIKGKCPYYTDLDRAHKALPSTHRFRILQELHNLAIINPHGETITLSHEERDCLYDLLEQTKESSFNSIRKHLNKNAPGVKFDNSWRFNLESEKRDKLKGNSASCDMRKPELFGDLWDNLDDERQDEIVEFIMNAEQDSDIEDYLSKEFSNKLSREQKENISSKTFARGIARFSSTLHRECVRVMKRDYCGYSDALAVLGFDHRAEEGDGAMEKLPYYGEIIPESCIRRKTPNQNEDEATYGKIGNPTVHIALNQIRKVVNTIISKHGKPTEIVLELSRNLKNGKKRIAEIISEQAKNQKYNEALNKELDALHIPHSRADREKLMYFRELQQGNAGAPCPYCGKIISAEELFNGIIEVEHILPFSRTLDDSRGNKTIAHKKCNLAKLNKSPYEAFGDSPAGYNWEHIRERIGNLPKAKQNKFLADAMEKREKDDYFLARQLIDGAYASRVALRYLTAICPSNKIWCVTGQHTAQLRWCWNLNTILSKERGIKNRSDHRHHVLDAVVIALIDRSLVKRIADENRKSDGDSNRFKYRAPEFPGGDEGREDLIRIMRSILPSFKPNHGIQGRFFKGTAYGKVKKPLLLETKNLNEDMADLIVLSQIRQEFKDAIAAKGFKGAKKDLMKLHKNLYVYKKLWVTSKPLKELKMEELKEPGYNQNTKGPSGFGIRRHLRDFIIKNAGHETPKGKELETILAQYQKEYGVRHIRYIPKNQVITEIKSSPGKGYELDGIAYVDVWRIPQKKGKPPKYQGEFVSYLEAAQIEQGKSASRKPHPAAKKITRLYKNDTLRVENKDGKAPMYYRIAGYTTITNRIDIQPIWRSEESWYENTNPISLHPEQMKDTATKNYKSINALWQEGGIRKITVCYDGSYR